MRLFIVEPEGEKGLMGQVQRASVSTAHEEGTVEGMGQVDGTGEGTGWWKCDRWCTRLAMQNSTVEFIR